jgi:hypothetical protein
MTRAARAVAALGLLVLLVGVGVAAGRPLLQMRDDIDVQRGLLAAQLETTRAQLRVAEQQLEVAEQSRDTARRAERDTAQLLALTKRLVELADSGGDDVADLRAMAARLVVLAQQLEREARSTERHAASIDRKTGPTLP